MAQQTKTIIIYENMKRLFPLLLILFVLTACKQTKHVAVEEETVQLVGPTFCGDSAMAYCAAQCAFGPRTMNSEAHEKCAEWIINKFKSYGCEVRTQKADIKAWDGNILHSTNIIASINPDAKQRIVICAHWDSRPWADNDPDSTNWHKPVMAANDGASGVGVMLEMARIINEYINSDSISTDSLPREGWGGAVAIDFVCFDAEDYGTPQWSDLDDTEDTWALGAQHYAKNLDNFYADRAKPTQGILLDMVGGQGAHFYYEGLSMHYAPALMQDVWSAAAQAGFSSYFINQQGGNVTDDHKPLNEAGVPTIDIISYYPDCEASGFGPTWHTIYDDMEHLDKDVLQAVGQTLIQYLFQLRDND